MERPPLLSSIREDVSLETEYPALSALRRLVVQVNKYTDEWMNQIHMRNDTCAENGRFVFNLCLVNQTESDSP